MPTPIPFEPGVEASQCSDELRMAGARAHNRFLAEFCSEAPGRLLGVPFIYPWPDWDAAVADMVWARETGFYAIFPPYTAGAPGDLPPLYDPWWNPMWAACQDLGLAAHIHVGFGNPQGAVAELARQAFGNTAGQDAGAEDGLSAIDPSMLPRFDPDGDGESDSSFLSAFFESFTERRPLWQLMWGGVFDRFPGLKVVFLEIHADWVPATLGYLDRAHAADPGSMKLTPTEYWQRHCAVGTSLMRYGDVAARHEVGLNKMMFGLDGRVAVREMYRRQFAGPRPLSADGKVVGAARNTLSYLVTVEFEPGVFSRDLTETLSSAQALDFSRGIVDPVCRPA